MKKKPYENLEAAPSVAGISPSERLRELRELEYHRMNVASAIEVVLDDYRKNRGKGAPARRRKKVGKGPHDYRP